MKLTVLIHFNAPEEKFPRNALLPYQGAPHLVVEGKCPLCQNERFLVMGDAKTRQDQSEAVFFAVAFTKCCPESKAIGTLRVEYSTLFGFDEDQAVLMGRPRVY